LSEQGRTAIKQQRHQHREHADRDLEPA
jgi:hypothetical protein